MATPSTLGGQEDDGQAKPALELDGLSEIPALPLKKAGHLGASLVAQWLRIRLPMQGTRVRALVPEDPTGCGATKPVHHNC